MKNPESDVQNRSLSPVFIDAYAGCGGLSLGLMGAGWNGLFAIEKDSFAFATLAANLIGPGARFPYAWPVWLERKPWTIEALMDTHGRELKALRGKVDLLAGGPPCQGFSSAGRRKPCDPRNKLVERYLEFVDLVQPGMVLIENVRGITYDFVERDGRGRRNFAEELIARLGIRYHVYKDTIDAASFGVPQQRTRFFLVGMLKERYPELPRDAGPFSLLREAKESFLAQRGFRQSVTSRQAISDLEKNFAGTIPCPECKGYRAINTARPRTVFQRAMRGDRCATVTDTRLANHRVDIVRRFEAIIAACRTSGRLHVQLNREMRERFGIKKMATRVLDPDKPAPTITSMPDDLLHYCEPRTLTVRENARLQTFPDWFEFKGKYTTGGERRAREVPRFTQVANAVPPLLAEQFGHVLQKLHKPARQRARKAA